MRSLFPITRLSILTNQEHPRGRAAAIIFLASLLAFELLTRLIFPQYADEGRYLDMAFSLLLNSEIMVDPSAETYSQKFGFKFSPNKEKVLIGKEYQYTVRTNSLGFRAPELEPKKPGEYRVLLLGDSMLFGVGVEQPQMLSAYLEQLPAEMSGPHLSLSVYNYSVTGYNTVQELLVARTYVRQVEPEQIILGFFTANDVIPNALTSINHDDNYIARAGRVEELRRQLKDSLSFCFGSVICRIAALGAYVPRVRYQISSRPEIIGESYVLLKSFRDLARENGAKFSVVIIHPRDGVEGGLVQSWSRSRKVGRLLADFCAANGIEVVDLLDFLKGKEARHKYFYRRDGHFNRAGNEVVARAIFDRAIRGRIAVQ